MLLNEVISSYLTFTLNNKNLSNLTIKAYRIDLKQFNEFVGPKKTVFQIDKALLTDFHTHLNEQELAPASIKRKFACIKAMFRWLELEELLTFNPFNKINLSFKLPKRLPRNVPRSDLQQMLKSFEANNYETGKKRCPTTLLRLEKKRDLNAFTSLVSIELMLSTGVRVCELANLKLHNVFVDDGKIKILGKGSRERYVYFPSEELKAITRAYIQARSLAEPNNDNLLINSRGKPASTQFIRKLIKTLSKNAHTQVKVTPHMLRHSAACELLDSGTDIRFVQRLLGHSSISTTEIYTHVADTVLKQKIEQAEVRKRIMD